MSLVKKALNEISDKRAKVKKEKLIEKTNQPIEIHKFYKDLIKKNNIFKDLKELDNEIKKFTPHVFFHLNDNSNNYLAELKEKKNDNDLYSELDDKYCNIIFADIYDMFTAHNGTNTMSIGRIGYCYPLKDGKSYWFWKNYSHNEGLAVKYYDDYFGALPLSGKGVYKFNTYKKMMVDFVKKELKSYPLDPDIKLLKPFGFFSSYKKKFKFVDSICLKNHNK